MVAYTSGPALLYATGGLAFGEVDTRVSPTDGVNSVSFSSDEVKAGYAVGGGIEWAFAPNWSLKSEYL